MQNAGGLKNSLGSENIGLCGPTIGCDTSLAEYLVWGGVYESGPPASDPFLDIRSSQAFSLDHLGLADVVAHISS